mmetsp:Transcript_32782/g.72988  ORF Transcript_32782/g.72988 Transcript_32782/m.72988 type:complete len:205 (+) Transcript_32782:130-744(+)
MLVLYLPWTCPLPVSRPSTRAFRSAVFACPLWLDRSSKPPNVSLSSLLLWAPLSTLVRAALLVTGVSSSRMLSSSESYEGRLGVFLMDSFLRCCTARCMFLSRWLPVRFVRLSIQGSGESAGMVGFFAGGERTGVSSSSLQTIRRLFTLGIELNSFTTLFEGMRVEGEGAFAGHPNEPKMFSFPPFPGLPAELAELPGTRMAGA